MAAARAPLATRRASVRREREREIVAATRALFDERGMQDAPIEEIARAVGINKALIYRCFASKEELFVLTLTSYLAELAQRLDGASGEQGQTDQPQGTQARAHAHAGAKRAQNQDHNTPPTSTQPPQPPELAATRRLQAGWRCYTDFCIEYPAFVDCGVSLMRRPADELRETISDAVWIRLGAAMASCLGRLSEILAAGAREGAFAVKDADFMANHLYTQTLGSMLLARIGVGVRTGVGGMPEPFAIDARRVQEACLADVLAAVGARS